MITNVKKDKKNNKVELSKLYSDGSYYTYEIDENKKTVFRKSVVLAFNEGIVEPVQKIVYPDLTFKTNEWETLEQLFLVKGFQPPLRNFKPRSKFKMNYKVTRRNFKFKSRNRSFNDCVEIEGKGTLGETPEHKPHIGLSKTRQLDALNLIMFRTLAFF